MSYRTYINDEQVFGNNEYYPEWIEFIESQGIEVDDYDGYYNGEITDFMGALEVIEKIVMRLEKEFQKKRKELERRNNEAWKIDSLFNFSNIVDKLNNQNPDDRFNKSLFDELVYYTKNGYAFMPYAFYMACQDKLEPAEKRTDGHYNCYQLKAGETISVSAG